MAYKSLEKMILISKNYPGTIGNHSSLTHYDPLVFLVLCYNEKIMVPKNFGKCILL